MKEATPTYRMLWRLLPHIGIKGDGNPLDLLTTADLEGNPPMPAREAAMLAAYAYSLGRHQQAQAAAAALSSQTSAAELAEQIMIMLGQPEEQQEAAEAADADTPE